MKRTFSLVPRCFFRTPLLAAMLAALTVAGCSSKKDSLLTGKVIYQEQPVTGGNLMLVAISPDMPPERAGPYLGAISPQGTFVVSGVPAGEWKVVLDTRSIQSMNRGNPTLPMGVRAEVDTDSLAASMPHYVEIPAQYSDPLQTPLRVTVTGGHQVHDLRLTD